MPETVLEFHLNSQATKDLIKNAKKQPYAVFVGMSSIGKTCLIDVLLRSLNWQAENKGDYYNNPRTPTSRNIWKQLTVDGFQDLRLIDTAGENFLSLYIKYRDNPDLDRLFSHDVIHTAENPETRDYDKVFLEVLQKATKIYVCLPLHSNAVDIEPILEQAGGFFRNVLRVEGEVRFLFTFTDLKIHPNYELPNYNQALRRYQADPVHYDLVAFFRGQIVGNDVTAEFLEDIKKYENFLKHMDIEQENNIYNSNFFENNPKTKPLLVYSLNNYGYKYVYMLYLPMFLDYYQTMELGKTKQVGSPGVLAYPLVSIDKKFTKTIEAYQERVKDVLAFGDITDISGQIKSMGTRVQATATKSIVEHTRFWFAGLSLFVMASVMAGIFGMSYQIDSNTKSEMAYMATFDRHTPNPYAGLSKEQLQEKFKYLVMDYERPNKGLYEARPEAKNISNTCASMFTNTKKEDVNYKNFVDGFYGGGGYENHLESLRDDVVKSTNSYLSREFSDRKAEEIRRNNSFPRIEMERQDCIHALVDFWKYRIELSNQANWNESEVKNLIDLFEKIQTGRYLVKSANIKDNIHRELPLLQAWQARFEEERPVVVPIEQKQAETFIQEYQSSINASDIFPIGVLRLNNGMAGCDVSGEFHQEVCSSVKKVFTNSSLAVDSIEVRDLINIDSSDFCFANPDKCQKERDWTKSIIIFFGVLALSIGAIVVFYKKRSGVSS